jgi:hypothetical protein
MSRAAIAPERTGFSTKDPDESTGVVAAAAVSV